MRGFGRRVTSAFRRDSRASIPDVVLPDAASSSSRSRSATPDISETLSAPAPKAAAESAVAPAETAQPEVKAAAPTPEPTPAPAAEPEAAPAPEEPKAESEVQPAPEAVAVEESSASVEEPEQQAYVLLAFSFKRKAKISGVRRNAAAVIVDEPDTLEECREVEAPIAVTEPEEAVHESPVEEESPASSIPVPELHHQSSDSCVDSGPEWCQVGLCALHARSIPAAMPSVPQTVRGENPFDTPSTQHESLGDNVHVVQ
jgi:hypothetical protein